MQDAPRRPKAGCIDEILLPLAFTAATPAWPQLKALPVDGMSEAQRADHRKLMRGYLENFRILGRAKLCRPGFDADPFFRELMGDMRLTELPASLVQRD